MNCYSTQKKKMHAGTEHRKQQYTGTYRKQYTLAQYTEENMTKYLICCYWPPEPPSSREEPIESISSIKIIEGACSLQMMKS